MVIRLILYSILVLSLGLNIFMAFSFKQATILNKELAAHYRACIGELEKNNNELDIIREIYGELD